MDIDKDDRSVTAIALLCEQHYPGTFRTKNGNKATLTINVVATWIEEMSLLVVQAEVEGSGPYKPSEERPLRMPDVLVTEMVHDRSMATRRAVRRVDEVVANMISGIEMWGPEGWERTPGGAL